MKTNGNLLKENNNKKRQSNIELLRIISMLLIISFHYVYKSGYVFEELNYNSFIVKMFYFFGELGVNLFILISGYFLINSKFSMKKLIRLILEINFYYIFSMILKSFLNHSILLTTFMDCFKLFFAVIFDRYWFATAYVLLYIMSPYINTFIHSIKKETFIKLLITVILLWSIIPTIFGIIKNDTETLLYYNRFIWMMVMYLIGAYIRLYNIKFFEKKNKSLIVAILSFVLMILSIFVIYMFSNVFNKLKNLEIAYFWRPNTILMLILSISIFEIFINFKIEYNKIINTLASTTLGIYLLHDGPLTNFLWKVILKTKDALNSKYSIIYIIVSALIIFLVGAIVDLIRQAIEKNTVNKFLDSKYYDKINNRFQNTFKKIVKNIF